MKFSEIENELKGIPYTTSKQAQILYDFVLEKRPMECLELGFAHGTSACYVAAALDELGEGRVTAVDLVRGQAWQHPSIEELLAKTGLGDRVTVIREKVSYTWFLEKKIEERTINNHCDPVYDFCYIDGPKNWTNDGCAFFLVDKLLRKGGTILFDDMSWTYDEASEWATKKLEESGILVSEMAEGERKTPHVERIFSLLVMQHPNYSDFVIQDSNWGWARKTLSPKKTLAVEETFSIGGAVKRRLAQWIRRSRASTASANHGAST